MYIYFRYVEYGGECKEHNLVLILFSIKSFRKCTCQRVESSLRSCSSNKDMFHPSVIVIGNDVMVLTERAVYGRRSPGSVVAQL